MGNDLINKIEQLREEMIKTTKEYGINDQKTLEISQKLDKYLNLYRKRKKSITL